MTKRGENLEYDKTATLLRIARNRVRELRADENWNCRLIERQGDLLRRVVNALRGPPPPDTLWSHHDAPAMAQKAADALREIAKLCAGGEFDSVAIVGAQQIYRMIPEIFRAPP